VEKEKEIAKLVNVLHRIARAASFSSWIKREEEAVKFCAAQYNRVLARLRELEPAVVSLFDELAVDASPHVVRMASHDLAAYFEDEIPQGGERHRHHRRQGHCRPKVAAFVWPHASGRGY
jgi:hypothetical protein